MGYSDDNDFAMDFANMLCELVNETCMDEDEMIFYNPSGKNKYNEFGEPEEAGEEDE